MPDLLIIRAPQQPEASVALNGEPVVIGSDPACTIVVSDPTVLPHHAYVAPENGAWKVTAYETAVALNVDNKIVPELLLDKTTRFFIGKTQIKFSRESIAPERRTNAVVTESVAENPEAAVAKLNQAMQRIRSEMARVVIGQSEVVNQILVALFARGHCLLVGTPGLAKTLMARTLADSLELGCKRVQFTPDLMPADITGTQVLEQDPTTSARNFRFKQGPIFTNLLLADEINRTPPKTQAALLEAMQERRVTISGQTYDLPAPFFVIATQNPIEQEGTYPLPEAQLDRFMFSVKVAYPNAADEERIIMETTQDLSQQVERVLAAEALIEFQHLVRKTPVSRHVGAYVTRIVRATRPDAPDAPDFIKNWVRWGAGPRAGQYLLLAAKSNALLQGRLNVSSDDVRAYALPVLRHRVLCNFAAASEGVDSDEIVRRLIASVPEPDYAPGD
jgi:MoxR-like ATPase